MRSELNGSATEGLAVFARRCGEHCRTILPKLIPESSCLAVTLGLDRSRRFFHGILSIRPDAIAGAFIPARLQECSQLFRDQSRRKVRIGINLRKIWHVMPQ